eukprot:gb/GEZN01006086.1/.p1 GENE.gb/GEZN01006086.1/~~gb/GEZN01006086.1/.p1  ORF type:complete len:419 (+),score=44.26 gb/GEZN01006086.1/:75-1331(+)
MDGDPVAIPFKVVALGGLGAIAAAAGSVCYYKYVINYGSAKEIEGAKKCALDKVKSKLQDFAVSQQHYLENAGRSEVPRRAEMLMTVTGSLGSGEAFRCKTSKDSPKAIWTRVTEVEQWLEIRTRLAGIHQKTVEGKSDTKVSQVASFLFNPTDRPYNSPDPLVSLPSSLSFDHFVFPEKLLKKLDPYEELCQLSVQDCTKALFEQGKVQVKKTISEEILAVNEKVTVVGYAYLDSNGMPEFSPKAPFLLSKESFDVIVDGRKAEGEKWFQRARMLGYVTLGCAVICGFVVYKLYSEHGNKLKEQKRQQDDMKRMRRESRARSKKARAQASKKRESQRQARAEVDVKISDSDSDSDGYKGRCIICYVAPCDAVFPACGHLYMCMTCARKCDRCPMCRVPKGDRPVIKVYSDTGNAFVK